MKLTIEERFWAKVERSGECLIWTAALYSNGYGMFWNGARLMRAHRFAYELAHGAIPEDLICLHNCPGGDNRRCVNVDHLFLGTEKDNFHDAVAKGRIDAGQVRAAMALGQSVNPHGPRFTREDVLAIRHLYASGFSPREIAKSFSAPVSTVRSVVYGCTWTHV